LIVFAFVVGMMLVFTVVAIQAGRRAIATWWHGREQRRIERIDNWQERGAELIWKGDTHQGRALLQKAWQRRPDNPGALLALADSLCETGEYRRASELLGQAANQSPASPDILFALAKTQRCAGDDGAGVAVLERLRALHPHAPRVLRALRDAYRDSARWADAAAVQEILVSQVREPGQVAAERMCLSALRYQVAAHLDEPASRVQALEALADSRTCGLPVWVSLGDAFRASARADEASLVWERALRTHPRTVLVERLASMATEERHRERLRTLLRKLRSDLVRADMVRLLTAKLCLQDGHAEQAARELDALHNAAAAPAFVHRLWAQVHRQRGQLEQALEAYANVPGDTAAYRCAVCGCTTPEWTGYCAQCHSWDSCRSEVEIGAL
jgi:tetratricopeptide (TPR) repeat protein